MDLVIIILIGIAAGFFAGQLMKGRGFGVLVNLLLGIVGSFIGNWLFGVLNISLGEGYIGTLLTAIIGAVVLLFVVGLIKGKK